ncbi:helix-turn-helix transcriptional regulator [Nocardioides hungaricus]
MTVPTTSPKPPPQAAQEFGLRVRERRHELGLSQEGLAEGTALHWSFIGRIERGQANLTLRNILRLAEVLGVDPADLVRGLRAD